MILPRLMFKCIFIILHHPCHFLLNASGEGLCDLEGKAVLSILVGRLQSQWIESELFIVLVISLGLLEGDGADGEREGGLIKAFLGVVLRNIMINRHFSLLYK